MSISENIKILRYRYDITQKELAEIAGVSDKAVSTWELGTYEPRMGAIQKIADHFGIQKSNIIEDGGMDLLTNNQKPDKEDELLKLFHERPLLKELFSELSKLDDDALKTFIQLSGLIDNGQD